MAGAVSRRSPLSRLLLRRQALPQLLLLEREGRRYGAVLAALKSLRGQRHGELAVRSEAEVVRRGLDEARDRIWELVGR